MPNYNAIVTELLNTLNANQDKRWNSKQLIDHVVKATKETRVFATAASLRALIAGGVIEGTLRGANSNPVGSVKYKPSSNGGNQQAEVTRLQNIINDLNMKLKTQPKQEVAQPIPQQQPTATVVEVRLKSEDGKKLIKSTKGVFHAQFAKLLQLAQSRMNIFIYGPTGCGKSHVCKQLADALNLSFAFVSCTSGMSEGVLGGRLLPVGKQGTFEYVISEFIQCYENGGVFLLDEMDAADPNVLLLINAALANGKMAVPNRPAKPYAIRHKDFICIAAANTAGTGADRMHNGRNKLDGATMDRFQVGKVVFDYDRNVEELVCKAKVEELGGTWDAALLNRCWKIRKAIQDNRLERAMSTRFIQDAYRMQTEFKWTYADIDASFFAGWRTEEVAKVMNEIN